MSLKKLIDSLSKSKDEHEKIIKNPIDVNPKDADKLYKENTAIFDTFVFLCEQISSSIKVDQIDEVSKTLLTDAAYNSGEQKALQKLLDKIKENNLATDIPSISGLSYKEAFDEMKGLLENKDINDLYQKVRIDVFKIEIANEIRFNPDKSFDILSNYLTEDVQNDIEKTVNEFTPNVYRKREYKLENKEQIEKLESKYNDSLSKESLEYIKDNVLKRRNKEDVGYDSLAAEKIIKIKKDTINIKNVEVTKNDPFFDKYVEFSNETYMFKVGMYKVDNQEELDENLRDNPIEISDDKKEIASNILDTIGSLKNIETGNDLLDLETYRPEEGAKIYAFNNMVILNESITNAINEGNIDKVNELANTHKEETKKMDNLIDEVDKLDAEYYPSNVSNARNEELPVKYAENFASTSMLNGLWHTKAFLKATGIDQKEFLDDPIGTYLDYVEQNKGLTEIDELGKNGDIDFLKNITNNKTRSNITRQIPLKYNNFRAFEAVAGLDNKNIQKNYLSFQYLKATKMLPFQTEKSKAINDFFSSLNKNKFKNILLNQNKDIKYSKLLNDKFDSKNYIKNNEIDTEEYLSKATSIQEACNNGSFNGKEKEILEAIKISSIELLQNKNLTSSLEFNDICKLSGMENYKAIRLQAGTKDIAKFVKNDYKDATKDGLNKDNILKAANSLKAISDQYNKRGFFGRHFRSEGRAEKALIETIKSDMTKAGISKDSIDSLLDGKVDIKNFKENFSNISSKETSNTKIKLDIKELDNNIVASKDEISKDKVQTLNLENQLENEFREI